MLPDDLLNWETVKSVFAQSRDGLLIVDRSGKILYTNPSYEQFLGVDKPFARNNFWGRSLFALNAFEELRQVLETGQPATGISKVIERAGLEVILNIIPVKRAKSVVAAILTGTIPQVANVLDTVIHSKNKYRRERMKFRPKATLPGPFQKILGHNVGLVKTLVKAAAAARTGSNILIQGESGTGKELLARAVHESGPRVAAPFVVVNCAAIPDTLLESELFGYEPGAFTGAARTGKPGKFELARGGTIFLDEVADLPLSIQAKLLRAIQFKQVEKVGGAEPVPVDVRIIAASNKRLEREVKKKRFREDLYYRLSVIPIEMPPLRERQKEDLFILSEHFLSFFCNQHDYPGMGFNPEVIMTFYRYTWPGNVRELKNVVEHAFVMAFSENLNLVLSRHLPPGILQAVGEPACAFAARPETGRSKNLKTVMKQVEEAIIRQTLAENRFDKKKTAAALGISRAKLYAELKRMKPHPWKPEPLRANPPPGP